MWLTVHHFLRALFGTNYRKFTRRQQVAIFRPRLEALEDRTLLSAYVVTTTADSGPGSLRDAINAVNADTSHALYASPSNPNVDEIDFNITAASDAAGGGTGFNATTGVATIQPHSALPGISNAVLIDGYTQGHDPSYTLDQEALYGASPNTLAQGDNAHLKIQLDLSADSVNFGSGLSVFAGNTTIRGLVMNDLNPSGVDYAIELQGDNNQVQGCFIGTDVSGSTVVGGGDGTYGVFQYQSSGNLIGGTTPDTRNLIDGFASGISSFPKDGGPQGQETVEGNFIGTDASGTKALGNVTGVRANYYDWTIADNLISGNQTGIDGSFGSEVIQGNLIGTDVTGTTALGNGTGVAVGLSGIVGGTTAAARNIISGNGTGIGGGSQGSPSSILIEGNYIGTDITGTNAVGNHVGVSLGGGYTLGGPKSGEGNLISGNDTAINLFRDNNVVQGNLIGTDYTGTQELLNLYAGIVAQGNNNIIGGLDTNAPGAPLAGAGNVIVPPVHGGAPAIGIGDGSGDVVEGNYIGTDITGTQVLGNDPAVVFGPGASGNTLGGTTAGARNIIAATYINPTIEFGGTATDPASNNVVEGNSIGIGSTGGNLASNSPVLGSFSAGVLFKDYASNNMVGGTAAGAGNVISGSYVGIWMRGSAGNFGNAFLGNSIFGNSVLGIEKDYGNDDQQAPVLTSASSSSSGTTVTGNLSGVANTTYRIEFFANQGLDSSGNAEGQTYLGFALVGFDANGNAYSPDGSATVSTTGSGQATFTATKLTALPTGSGYLTATATVATPDGTGGYTYGDSSQFSGYIVAPPTADAGGPYSIQEGQSLTLNGSGSYDPLGNPLSYAWDINGAGTFSAATGVSPTLTWAQLQALGVTDEGSFTVQLRVTASNGSTATSSPVALTVTDAPLSTSGLTLTPTAGAPFSGVLATFTDAYAGAAAGDYSASINWGDGNVTTGTISADGRGGFNVNGSHTYAASGPYAVSVTINDVGGSTATANSTANVASLGQTVQKGEGPGVGFWHNSNGQALIDAFNGGLNSTVLSTWLASTFPNLYGVNAGANNLTGKTNAQVAAFDLLLFNESGLKLDAQVLATALNVYATTLALGGTTGQSYGFLVDAYGLGARSYNVGANGAAFGVPNNTTLNVYQILLAANQQAVNGVLYNGNATFDNEANGVFSGINQAGGI